MRVAYRVTKALTLHLSPERTPPFRKNQYYIICVDQHLEQDVEFSIASKIVCGKIVPKHLMRGTQIVVRNNQLAHIISKKMSQKLKISTTTSQPIINFSIRYIIDCMFIMVTFDLCMLMT